MSYNGHTRFRPGADADFAAFKTAATDYVVNLAPEERLGLLEKPLDWGLGHVGYFMAMYQLFNGLQALRLTPGDKLLEVGGGAGWATEIMASLAYRVTVIEPSAAMIDVARQRVQAHVRNYGKPEMINNVSWQCAVLEEALLFDGFADAAIFFESFHHLIDEHEALRRTFAALRPGGQIAILGDSNWNPGNRQQEEAWIAEMAAFGTLESPFTDAYLVWLLDHHGFVDIQRNHMVNGLIPIEREAEPIANFIQLHASGNNLVLARKPG